MVSVQIKSHLPAPPPECQLGPRASLWLCRNGARCQPERRALCQRPAVILPASISASCLGLAYRHIVAYYPRRNTCRRDLHCNFNHKVLQIIDAARPRSAACSAPCSAACSAACSPGCSPAFSPAFSPARREAGQELANLLLVCAALKIGYNLGADTYQTPQRQLYQTLTPYCAALSTMD